jgi:molybdopterin-binding protein
MLDIKSLSVSTGSFRLRDVNLSVGNGQCHAILGPSGAGKTTLLNAILGVLMPDSGSICIDGIDISRIPIEKRALGYVPQQLGLFPHLTVSENLAYSARARGVDKDKFLPLINKLVEATGIGGLLNRYPKSLSGGESKRVSLVRALVSEPRVVLLDEPFVALNESLRRELWWLISELQNEWGLTMLLVSHDLTEAYYLASNITVIMDGSIVQQGSKSEVYSQPAAREIASFLGIETLQPGHIVSVQNGLVTVQVGSTQLIALERPGISSNVLVSIRGEDVTLESNDNATVSARNRLQARVVSVRFGTPLLCVELDAGFPLFASITRPAYEELGLKEGSIVSALIKAPSVHLIPRQ